jgi:uncharacterized protein (DUF885 family)
MLGCGPSLLAQTPRPSLTIRPQRCTAFSPRNGKYELDESPTHASTLGDRRANDRWDDISLDAIQKRFTHTEAALTRLRGIARARLSPADQLNYDLFEQQAQRGLEGARFRGYPPGFDSTRRLQFAEELRRRAALRNAEGL